MFPLAKFAVAPGWHFPQVTGRLFWWIVERGSDDLKISWTPWQEEQFATVLSPTRADRPWKLCSYPFTFPTGTPYRAASLSAAWQDAHILSDTAAKETGEAGSEAWRMSCSPWQSAQLGASGRPRWRATPCTLSR